MASHKMRQLQVDFFANPVATLPQKRDKKYLALNLPERCNLHPSQLHNFITRSIISVHFWYRCSTIAFFTTLQP